MEARGKELNAEKDGRRELERGGKVLEGGTWRMDMEKKELELGIGHDGQNGRSWREL